MTDEGGTLSMGTIRALCLGRLPCFSATTPGHFNIWVCNSKNPMGNILVDAHLLSDDICNVLVG